MVTRNSYNFEILKTAPPLSYSWQFILWSVAVPFIKADAELQPSSERGGEDFTAALIKSMIKGG